MLSTTKQHFKIALIGVEFEENLSLRYLAGSLLAAGYSSVHVQGYNSLLHAEELAADLISQNFDLIGISMAFQVRAIEDMAIIQLLRQGGYKNHITAGGQFATLHYSELFVDCAGLDSVIRFEGETAMVQLADTLRLSASLTQVPGLVWQDENKLVQVNTAIPAPGDINELSYPLRNNERIKVLGLKTVQMIGSRGCHATCKYCCVSALATERSKASKESGTHSALPGTRRRTAQNVASEMADLYFKHEVRIFEFQDDNWIPPKVSQAITYFSALKKELDKLAVGKIGITLKTRADSVQPEIIKVLKELGLIRVFVGIESGTQNLLSKLGRKSRDQVSLQALQILREHKIPAYFNALLFGPDIKFEDIEPELQFLENCSDFPFEIVEVVIYGKTGLYQSLKKENRLFGNYLDYDYEYLDQATQLSHQLISKLETRHFGVYSPVKMAADLGFNLGILQVFNPGDFCEAMSKKVNELTVRINTDQIRIIRKAASLASAGLSLDDAGSLLINECISIDLQFYTELIQLQNHMEGYVKSLVSSADVHAYYRVGSMVQSGLIASLFLLLSSQTQAQNLNREETVNEVLKQEMVNYIYHPGLINWLKLKQHMLNETTPLRSVYHSVLLGEVMDRDYKANIPQYEHLDDLSRFEKKLDKVVLKRIREDYKRLNDILIENRPKIKIASSLAFILDDDGKVVDIETRTAGSDKPLSHELKKIILDLLADKKFFTNEAVYRLEHIPKRPPQLHINTHPFRKKHRRQGPLD